MHLAGENNWTSEEMEKAADATGFNWREARLTDRYWDFIKKRG